MRVWPVIALEGELSGWIEENDRMRRQSDERALQWEGSSWRPVTLGLLGTEILIIDARLHHRRW